MISDRNQRRWLNLAGLGVVAALMAYALYSEHVVGLEACPLCIFQRMAMIALGAVFLLAGVHSPASAAARVYAFLGVVTAGIGIAIAGRHVWLQSLPEDQVPACGPGYDYIMDVFPLMEALNMIFTGSGECAEINWQFMGLSMPGWVLIWFVLLGGLVVAANWQRLSR